MYKKHLGTDLNYYFTNEQGLIVYFLYNSNTKKTRQATTKYKKVANRWEKQLNDTNSGIFAVRF